MRGGFVIGRNMGQCAESRHAIMAGSNRWRPQCGRRYASCSGVCSGIRLLTSMALKRVAESFHLETGAKQRKQAPHQYDSALDRQQDVGLPAQFRKMPEDDDREQRAAKDKAEAPQKQKRVIQECVRASKRNRNIAQPAPERDLHDAEHTDHHQISRDVFWKLFPRG
jgi:hypothetical protein